MELPTEDLFEEKRRPAFPFRLIVLAAASGTAVYFSTQGDYGAATAIVFLSVALRSGYRAGAATFLGLFAGGALAAVAAIPLGKAVEPLFEYLLGTQGLTNRVLCIGTVGTSLVLVATLAVRHSLRRLVRHEPRWQRCDRWLGLACGGIQGSLLILILAGGVTIVEPLARDELLVRGPADRSLARLVSEQVVMAAETTRSGKLGPIVAAGNPFQHIGPLKNLQHGVELLRSPESLLAVAEHPAVESLYHRPEMQETLDQLSADPELRDVLTCGEPITRQTLASLMRNPAVLRLLDDPEFIRDLSRVLAEIDPGTLLSSTAP